jgi:hypothetical protein
MPTAANALEAKYGGSFLLVRPICLWCSTELAVFLILKLTREAFGSEIESTAPLATHDTTRAVSTLLGTLDRSTAQATITRLLCLHDAPPNPQEITRRNPTKCTFHTNNIQTIVRMFKRNAKIIPRIADGLFLKIPGPILDRNALE